jgi:hypothetical protein
LDEGDENFIGSYELVVDRKKVKFDALLAASSHFHPTAK